MRKELPNTYTEIGNGAVGVKARTPDQTNIEFEIPSSDLHFEICATNSEGLVNRAKVHLLPVVSKVIRADSLFDSNERERLFYLAALNCYSNLSTPDLIAKARETDIDEVNTFLKTKILAVKHFSVIEHEPPAFMIDGVSRAFTHQLVRHRLFSYSQQSQRYVDFAPKKGTEEMTFPFIIPPSIRYREKATQIFVNSVKNAITNYFQLRSLDCLPEDARYLLQNTAASRIVMSGNLRTWQEMIPKRTCARAQWEIDMVTTEITRQISSSFPDLMEKIGPACSNGKCDQGAKSCGVPLNFPMQAFFNKNKYPHDLLIFGMI